MVAAGFITRRHAVSQAFVNSSYAEKLANLSQSSSTAATRESSGLFRSLASWRLYGGSAKTRSTEAAGNFAIPAMQSPTRTRCGCGLSDTPRGALWGAPRRDTTMTQDSDSGDAVGDAGPTTDRPAY